MRGERVFYPMGFDDNGLLTERYVERTYGVKAVDMPRAVRVAARARHVVFEAADHDSGVVGLMVGMVV